MTPEEQAVEAKLKELDILYERHDHEPIMTVAEGVRGRDQRLHFGRIKVVIC